MADPWTFAGERLTRGTRRPGDPGRRVRLRDLQPRRRHGPRCRPRASSSATPGSCPAGPCGSTDNALSRWPAPSPDPYSATFVARSLPRPGRADSTLMVRAASLRRAGHARGPGRPELRRGAGLLLASSCSYDADFADLFAVKEGRVTGRGERDVAHEAGGLVCSASKNGARRRSLRSRFSQPAVLDGDVARWEVIIPSEGQWALCQQFTCGIDDDEIEPRWLCGAAGRAGQAGRAPGGLAAQCAGRRHRPRGPAGRGRPQRRGPRRPADLRSRLSRSGPWWPPAPRGS